MHPRVCEILSRPNILQRSPEWYEFRKGCLTASRCGDVIAGGKKAKDLLKSFVYPEFNFFTGNEHTRRGVVNEDVARKIYEQKYDEVVNERGIDKHPIHTWLAGSPDGITSSGKLIEIKCPNQEPCKEVPKQYMAQIQVLMEIYELESCDFIQFHVPTQKLVVFNCARDRGWFEKNLPVMKQFWLDVIDGKASKSYKTEFRDDPRMYYNENSVPPV